jgi:hypothetical protein
MTFVREDDGLEKSLDVYVEPAFIAGYSPADALSRLNEALISRWLSGGHEFHRYWA